MKSTRVNIKVSKRFSKLSYKLMHKDNLLRDRLKVQLDKFRNNPNYPGLHSHKVKINGKEAYSIRITGDLRVIYYWHNDTAVLVTIGTHDEVYGR